MIMMGSHLKGSTPLFLIKPQRTGLIEEKNPRQEPALMTCRTLGCGAIDSRGGGAYLLKPLARLREDEEKHRDPISERQ